MGFLDLSSGNADGNYRKIASVSTFAEAHFLDLFAQSFVLIIC